MNLTAAAIAAPHRELNKMTHAYPKYNLSRSSFMEFLERGSLARPLIKIFIIWIEKK